MNQDIVNVYVSYWLKFPFYMNPDIAGPIGNEYLQDETYYLYTYASGSGGTSNINFSGSLVLKYNMQPSSFDKTMTC